MSHQYYSEINLHFVWHTKNNLPLITDRLEPFLHDEIRKRALGFKGVILHALNGTENHVHLAVSILPTVNISTFVGEVKGASSHTINNRADNREPFAWQIGYGVVSFGTRDLPWVVEYIKKQKEHHATGKVQDRLERIADDETLVSEQPLNTPAGA